MNRLNTVTKSADILKKGYQCLFDPLELCWDILEPKILV